MAGAGTLERGHDDEVLRASRVSRFSLTSPPAALSAAGMVALAGALGGALSMGPARLDAGTALALAFGGVLLPALAAAMASFTLMARLSGAVTWGRVFVLGLTDMGLVLALVLLFPLVPSHAGDTWLFGLVAGVAWAAAANMLVLAATSYPRMATVALPALLLPVGTALALVVMGVTTPPGAVAALVVAAAFMLASAGWARVVVHPFRRALKEDGLALLQALLDAWAGWSVAGGAGSGGRARGTVAMEAFFSRHGQAGSVRFRAASFRRQGAPPVTWLLPDLHPGPYADLGGSDLPSKVAGAMPGSEVLTFHGASTHDQNPCSRADVEALARAVGPALGAAPEDATATPAVSVSQGGVGLLAQRIGRQTVLVHSRAPASSDDIDLAAGQDVERAGAGEGAPPVALVDAHNCVADDLGRTEDGSSEHQALRAAALAAQRELAGGQAVALRAGFARRVLPQARARTFAVGRHGIAATVIETGSQKAAYVLIDGNNLKSGLRAPMLEAVAALVDVAEVLTTDNHAVNTTMGADNEVGSRGDNGPLVEEVAGAVRDAVADLKPATVAWAEGKVPGVRVFGPGLTVRMSEAINAAVGRMIPVYMVAAACALAASWAVWYLPPA